MKITLKVKLLGAFFGIIMFVTILSWFLNSTLLETYYISRKTAAMMDCYKSVVEAYTTGKDNVEFVIDKNVSIKGINTLILDKELRVIYESRQRGPLMGGKYRRTGFDQPFLNEHLLLDNFKKLTDSKPIIQKVYDDRMDSYFISLYSKIDKNTYVYMGTPVKAIEESAKIATTFSVFTGILILILGGIIILFLTSRLTKPIVKLNQIARKMSSLDFSERYTMKSSDEIGTLGESINSLSEQLETSIGELRRANAKLLQDIEKERKIDEMRKEFISNVSHELKTPIALIQGYSEGLLLNVNEDEENKNYYCEVIKDEAIKMNILVRKLLSLSELESNNIPLEREDFGICEIIENVLKKKSIDFDEKGINIEFINKCNVNITVNADYYLIEQVLFNYLSNAINHIDSKKIIRVEVEKLDNKIRVNVFNSGKHIPEDVINNIWISFYKVDKSRTRAYGGTGLGLSIVRAIQNAHNNRCGVGNVQDGVLFWFELDIVDENI